MEAQPQFLFTVKLFRGFTHSRNATLGEYRSVCRLLDALNEGQKLHGLVLQFPSSFFNSPERRAYLAKLAQAFRSFTLFLDVRHNSWNTSSSHRFLQEQRLHLINIDLPRIGRHMPFQSIAWDGRAYFRLMGRNSQTWFHPERGDRYAYLYSREELEELARMIARAHTAAHSTFVIFHNDPEANSLINGFQLRRLLSHPHETAPASLLDLMEASHQHPRRAEIPLFSSLSSSLLPPAQDTEECCSVPC